MMTWGSNFFHFPNNSLLEMVTSMHDYVMMFLFSIMMLVVLSITFNFLMKPFSMEFFEHHELESIWTVTPFVLLMFIIFPSISVLYNLDSCLFCGICVNIIGHQWYWSYSVMDLDDTSFDSYMMPQSALRLIDVDNRISVPCGVPVRFMATSADVIHSWTVPSFGVKMDAIPGRINQVCLSSKRSGIFFGQCSEICGSNHSFMPIVMEVHPFKNLTLAFILKYKEFSF